MDDFDLNMNEEMENEEFTNVTPDEGSETTSDEKSGLGTGAIIGIAAAGVAGVAGIVTAIVRHRKKRKEEKAMAELGRRYAALPEERKAEIDLSKVELPEPEKKGLFSKLGKKKDEVKKETESSEKKD